MIREKEKIKIEKEEGKEERISHFLKKLYELSTEEANEKEKREFLRNLWEFSLRDEKEWEKLFESSFPEIKDPEMKQEILIIQIFHIAPEREKSNIEKIMRYLYEKPQFPSECKIGRMSLRTGLSLPTIRKKINELKKYEIIEKEGKTIRPSKIENIGKLVQGKFPTFKIFWVLKEKPLTIAQLQRKLNLTYPTLKSRLSALIEGKLIKKLDTGKEIFYLTPENQKRLLELS